jgi:hypothetical protein
VAVMVTAVDMAADKSCSMVVAAAKASYQAC